MPIDVYYCETVQNDSPLVSSRAHKEKPHTLNLFLFNFSHVKNLHQLFFGVGDGPSTMLALLPGFLAVVQKYFMARHFLDTTITFARFKLRSFRQVQRPCPLGQGCFPAEYIKLFFQITNF